MSSYDAATVAMVSSAAPLPALFSLRCASIAERYCRYTMAQPRSPLPTPDAQASHAADAPPDTPLLTPEKTCLIRAVLPQGEEVP